MVTRYPTKAAANAAIRAQIAEGKATGGYAALRFGGMHGHYYTAHVRKGAAGWCL